MHGRGYERVVILVLMSDDPYTSALARELAEDLLARFLRYVRIDTQSHRDRTRSPSTDGQLELGRLLADELREAGLEDASLDGNGYVMATLLGTTRTEPAIGLIAHLDTTPDASGAGVSPIVHRDYDGGVLELPRAGTRLDPAVLQELRAKVGHDLVTASGDTLLGADNKAGIAAIVTAVRHLAANPTLPRPTIKVAFTPDEEIGEGATLFDIDRFGALCAYTIDGSELGELQDETFAAFEATVTVEGIDVHPGHATGKLVNALRLAADIVCGLPDDHLTPATTSNRGGFIHPYELTGSPARASLRTILRDFDEHALASHVALLRRAAERVAAKEPRAKIELAIRRQYRNMRSYLEAVPFVVAAAEEAIRAEGIEPVRNAIRGGTDGSRLSEMGLPTPNIFTGGHEFHSVREWASVQDMAAAAATIVRLAEVWTKEELLAVASAATDSTVAEARAADGRLAG
jgi:tripeptide aminopeptidase